jgi:hypothetical protein
LPTGDAMLFSPAGLDMQAPKEATESLVNGFANMALTRFNAVEKFGTRCVQVHVRQRITEDAGESVNVIQ